MLMFSRRWEERVNVVNGLLLGPGAGFSVVNSEINIPVCQKCRSGWYEICLRNKPFPYRKQAGNGIESRYREEVCTRNVGI